MSGLMVFALLAAAALLLSLRAWNRSYSPLNRPREQRGEAPAKVKGGEADGIEDPALMLDLAAAMLEAGQPMGSVLGILARPCRPAVRTAVRRAAAAMELGAQWNAAWELAAEGVRSEDRDVVNELASALAFAGSTGAPSARLLYAHAAQYRRRRNRAAEKRAASLGVKLVVPLGVCALPAFICLGVMPVLFALVPALG